MEFVSEFHAEINRQRAAEEIQAADLQAELGRLEKKLSGLYAAAAHLAYFCTGAHMNDTLPCPPMPDGSFQNTISEGQVG